MPRQSPAAAARSRPHAILFDVDGTLIDSNDAHAAAWVDAFREGGYDIPFASIRYQIGKGSDNLIPALLPDASANQIERLGKASSRLYLSKHAAQVTRFPAVCALFGRLRSDGIRIVLATSAGAEVLSSALKLIGCADLVDTIVNADDAGRSKPCPDIFQAALAKIGVQAADTLVVGDTPYDVEAANRAALRTVALKCGGFPPHTLEAAGAIALYRDPADLLANYDRWVVL